MLFRLSLLRYINVYNFKRKREEILLSPMTKGPYTNRNYKKGKAKTQKRHQTSSITQ